MQTGVVKRGRGREFAGKPSSAKPKPGLNQVATSEQSEGQHPHCPSSTLQLQSCLDRADPTLSKSKRIIRDSWFANRPEHAAVTRRFDKKEACPSGWFAAEFRGAGHK